MEGIREDMQDIRRQMEEQSKDINSLQLETGKVQLETVQIREDITTLTADSNKTRVQIDDHASASQLQVTALSTSIIEVRAELCSVRSRGDSQSAVQHNQSSELMLLKDMVGKQSVTLIDHALEFKKRWSELGERQNTLTSLEQRLAGNSKLWEKADVIIFSETWESTAASKIVIPGFFRIASVWNKKMHSRGRGFGGLAVWTRHHLGLDTSVEAVDDRKQYIAMRFSNKKGTHPFFVVAVYFAPAGSPVYSELGTGTDPYSDISNVVRSLKELGMVNVVDDFNSRIANQQNEDNHELGSSVW
ncbi:hypothetical protein R1sor_027150 [Riccia sorocarpa]|uniref:Uncharacterized protein n=1 Tax=Riccia sorocarpa TaxID=122646 RepID=A0ABD3GF46_9MARC